MVRNMEVNTCANNQAFIGPLWPATNAKLNGSEPKAG